MAIARIIQRYRENGTEFVYLVFNIGTEDVYARINGGAPKAGEVLNILYTQSGQRLEITSMPGYPRAVGKVLDLGNASGKVTNSRSEAATWNLDQVEKITSFQVKDVLKRLDWTNRALPVLRASKKARDIKDEGERLQRSQDLLSQAWNARQAVGLAPWSFHPIDSNVAEAKQHLGDAKEYAAEKGAQAVAATTEALQAGAKAASEAVNKAAEKGLEGLWDSIPDGAKIVGGVVVGSVVLYGIGKVLE